MEQVWLHRHRDLDCVSPNDGSMTKYSSPLSSGVPFIQFSIMDFIVIPLHKVTSYISSIVYLYILRLLLVVYLAVITTLGVLTAAVVLLRHFRTPAYRWMRTGLFLALGLFGIVPTLHGICLYGVSVCSFKERKKEMTHSLEQIGTSLDTISLGYLVVMAISYVSGALIYACR